MIGSLNGLPADPSKNRVAYLHFLSKGRGVAVPCPYEFGFTAPNVHRAGPGLISKPSTLKVDGLTPMDKMCPWETQCRG
jgi:hypothetical protein